MVLQPVSAQQGGAPIKEHGAPGEHDRVYKRDKRIKSDIKVPERSHECKDRIRYIPSRYRSPMGPVLNVGKTPEPTISHKEFPAPYPQDNAALTMIPDPISTGGFYLEPANMKPEQIEKFKYNAKFDKMSVHDYVNWLTLFKDEPEKLAGFHRANLRIVLRGGTLTPEDLPKAHPLPDRAEHEYMKIIKQGTIDNIPQPEFANAGVQPSNYDIDIGSPPNRSLRHLDFVNPDEPLKTWVLTRESSKLKT
jgi:hypothetical protein